MKRYDYLGRVVLLALGLSAGFAAQAQQTDQPSGYYLGARLVNTDLQLNNMDLSARPSIGRFVPGRQANRFTTASLAAGYQFGNGWRAELEYTPGKRQTFTSGSSAFPTSLNNHEVKAQRLMLNGYFDFPFNAQMALYATAGVGIAKVESSGWQGNRSRTYRKSSQNNLAYAFGAGVSYRPTVSLTLDLGWRAVNMGDAVSGYNAFRNVRGLQDEQMRGRAMSREWILGVRYGF